MKKLILFAILAATVAAFTLRFRQAGQEVTAESIADVQAREGVPVEVAAVEREDLEIWRAYAGTVEGIEQTAVVSSLSEEAVEVACQVGDRVAAGDVLVRLARRRSQVGYRQNLAAFENAVREEKRLSQLFEAGAISEQQLDGARTQLSISRANLEAAEAYLDIVAPIGGVVVERNVEVGDQVQPGAPLLVLADLSQALVKVQMTGRDARQLELGQQARLAADEDPSRRPGAVHRIALAADPKTRLVEVELRFDNPDGLLIPGTLASTEVLLERQARASVVPKQAVVRDEGGAYLWTVDDSGLARRRPVELGLVNTTVVEILDGIGLGETVVTAGANLLQAGGKTRIVADAARGS